MVRHTWKRRERYPMDYSPRQITNISQTNNNKLVFLAPAIVMIITILTGAILMSSTVKADNDSVVDQVNITVPVSCTMSGTGMNTHNAEIQNGIYTPNIGTTTLHALCNDAEGFAIYATGYTGNEIGGTNSNKLVGTAASNNAVIETGLATSAGNPDISNWAMKLTATQDSGDTTGTNAFTIDNSFNAYHAVPSDYTKVAHKNSATDMTETIGGVKLTTTYAAYISKTQPADTYSGQVKYTLVHPSTADAPITPNQVAINFHGNGLTFAGGANKNRVVYEKNTENRYVIVGNEYEVSKTNNVDNNGNVLGSLTDDGQYAYGTINIESEGADMIKVVFSFDARHGFEEACPGGYISISGHGYCDYSDGDITLYIEGDSVEITYQLKTNEVNYYYAKVYPAYYANPDDPGAESAGSITSIISAIGTYTETTTWNGKWYGEIPYEYEDCYWDDELEDEVCEVISDTNLVYFEDEDEIIEYIRENESLLGTIVDLYAYNPYRILYNGNGATAGTMSGFYTSLNDNTSNSTADLMAYNFKKTGYGFAGWSENPNATVNGSSKIYGPNEKIAGNELTFDSNQEATLYAVWVPSAGSLQGWSGCSSMTSGQVTALTDSRDNNVYTVGKLADGNCWMMENLRLDAANSGDSTKAQGFGGMFTGLADSEDVADFTIFSIDNSKYNTTNILGDNKDYRFPRYNNNNTNIGGTNSDGAALTITPGVWDQTHYSYSQYEEGNNDHSQWYGYGNYYSWAAAMANTTEMDDASASESANTSICPAGWKLPYGDNTGNGASSGGFSYLDIQMGGIGETQWDNDEEVVSNRWRSYPNNFVYSGHIEGGSVSRRGESGLYWSSTAIYYRGAYNLWFESFYVYPGTNSALSMKYYGEAIRCVASGA